MQSGHYNAAADVFSFGIVISEVVAATEAEEIVDDTRTNEFGLDVQKVKAMCCSKELLGERNVTVVEQLVDLAGWCCQLDPSERPSTDQIVGGLQRIQLEYQAKHLKSPSTPTHRKTTAPMADLVENLPHLPSSSTRDSGTLPEHAASSLLVKKSSDIEDCDEEEDDEEESDDGTLVSEEDGSLVSVEQGVSTTMPPLPPPSSITIDPLIAQAAIQVFEMVDQNKDGFLCYEETRLLSKLSEDYDLSPDAYQSICLMVGASSDIGLSQQQVIQMYTHLKIGDAQLDLQKLHESL